MSDKIYVCKGCGGKTRFVVEETTKTRYYHHQTVGQDIQREDVEVLQTIVTKVTCTYCNHGQKIEEQEPLLTD